MYHFICDYVRGCAQCQANKVNTQKQPTPLIPISPTHALPFHTVAMDFITKLPKSNGYDTILTITDHDCTKAHIFIPCNKIINAAGVAKLYFNHVFKHFGILAKIILD